MIRIDELVGKLDKITAICRQLKHRTPDKDEAYEQTRDRDDTTQLVEKLVEKTILLLLLGFGVEPRKKL
jgi:hypothetical protein